MTGQMARRKKLLKFGGLTLFGALAAVAAAPDAAQAGFFDFLFGGPDKGPHPSVTSYAEPTDRVSPPALGQESVRGSVATGRPVAYCVRLCDGQHFPLARLANATPVETCNAMCPASPTKVFFGSEIDHAVAKDGSHYTDLSNAYLYRKRLVPKCTCNGRDAFGLAKLNLASDPTLRPGDIVATKQGLMAYNGNKNPSAAYTPVSTASVATQLNSITSGAAGSQKNQEEVEDDPGTIQGQPPPLINVGIATGAASTR
jgi:hypothetical protein